MLTVPEHRCYYHHVRRNHAGTRSSAKTSMKRLWLVVYIGVLFASGSAWGAIAACATAATGNAFNTAAYVPSSVGNGCGAIDLSFENLGHMRLY